VISSLSGLCVAARFVVGRSSGLDYRVSGSHPEGPVSIPGMGTRGGRPGVDEWLLGSLSVGYGFQPIGLHY
jgi:hypothetical protein